MSKKHMGWGNATWKKRGCCNEVELGARTIVIETKKLVQGHTPVCRGNSCGIQKCVESGARVDPSKSLTTKVHRGGSKTAGEQKEKSQ